MRDASIPTFSISSYHRYLFVPFPFPSIPGNNSLWFPFPNFGKVFFHSLPVPEFRECLFSFPSRSRILGMDLFIPFPFPNFGNGLFQFPLKDVPPFLRRDQTDWHRYQSKYLTRIVGNLFWGWKREGGGGWELRIEFQPNFQSKNFFARGKPSFLKENSLWTGWIFLPELFLEWGSDRDSLQQSESSFDWEIFYRTARCLERQRNYHDWTRPILPLWFTQKQTKHKVMILYWIYS